MTSQPKKVSITNRGSSWNRWDPHIHTPETVLNNQFTGSDPWGAFEEKLNSIYPPIKALGITDYFTIDTYEKMTSLRAEGKFSSVEFIFPNIELRFDVGTQKGSGINAHLLVNPHDPEHIAETRRFLNHLTFTVGEDTYRCNTSDLVKLGKAHDPSVADGRKALEVGANQFKVNFYQLRDLLKNNSWAQTNILLAVAGGSNDGTSGLQNSDSSFAAVRIEIERCSHIIFSSSDKQRQFWLGKDKVSKTELISKWGGRKPCLHGSDAHNSNNIGAVHQDRFTWIKGDLSFETLRQACIEPEGRTYIGKEPPTSAVSSCVIKSVEVSNAPWLEAHQIPLNSGLVAVIGARGSGKTALVDLIAAGGFSAAPHSNNRSFIHRAMKYFQDEEVQLNWESGTPTKNALILAGAEDIFDSPKVQYLSQQFVDTLCSAEGITDDLLGEIERVIFQAHNHQDRMGSASFDELLSLKANTPRDMRKFYEQSIADDSSELAVEREKKDNLPNLQKLHKEKKLAVENDRKDRQSLLGKSESEKSQQHAKVSSALDKVRATVDILVRQHQSLIGLKEAVTSAKSVTLPNFHAKMKEKFQETNLKSEQWKNFELTFVGDVDSIIQTQMLTLSSAIEKLKGPKQPAVSHPPSETSSIQSDAILEDQTLHLLEYEQIRLQMLLGIEKENSKRYAKLCDKIAKEESDIAKLARDISAAEQSITRIAKLREQRKSAYQKVFEALLSEQTELCELYRPLMERLKNEQGTLSKLTFNVHRTADILKWSDQGEELLDLRKSGPFKGKGMLHEAVKLQLQEIWESGTPEDISHAMGKFIAEHEAKFVEHAPVDKSDRAAYRAWLNAVSTWLYSTEHIQINYGVQYDGVNIQQLSPGTRGIVLLLLYLAIDEEDDRPLIIDQPEENLDPKSIFDELVNVFHTAKQRRQIIIVTHNANLVVNTDADQVIVARCGPQRSSQLPLISYTSGGLENPEIRKLVCEILEGGESAFRERAKRLRVNF